MKRKREFKCVSVVERLPGIINTYRGVIVYLPESEFSVRDKVRVTVVRMSSKCKPKPKQIEYIAPNAQMLDYYDKKGPYAER